MSCSPSVSHLRKALYDPCINYNINLYSVKRYRLWKIRDLFVLVTVSDLRLSVQGCYCYRMKLCIFLLNSDKTEVVVFGPECLRKTQFNSIVQLLWMALPYLTFQFYHDTLNDQFPSYLKDFIVWYFPNRALCSQTGSLLVVPRVSKSSM